MNFDFFGRAETIGLGYTLSSSNVPDAHLNIESRLRYGGTEKLNGYDGDWTWNTDATYYYASGGPDEYYLNNNGAGNLGLISWRYGADNSLEMWHETNNELIATKTAPLDGNQPPGEVIISSRVDWAKLRDLLGYEVEGCLFHCQFTFLNCYCHI